MNRRTFLKTTAIGGAASTLPIPAEKEAVAPVHFKVRAEQMADMNEMLEAMMLKCKSQMYAHMVKTFTGKSIDLNGLKWKKVRPPIL